MYIYMYIYIIYIYIIYRVPQEVRSLLQDLIPELILSQKRHIGPIGNGSGITKRLHVTILK